VPLVCMCLFPPLLSSSHLWGYSLNSLADADSALQHVYVWPHSSVGQWNLHSMVVQYIILVLFCLVTPFLLAMQFHQVGEQLYQVMWGRDLKGMLLDIANCGGLRYILETQVNKLGIQDLGYNEKVLLVCHEYISAFNQLTSMSLNDRSRVVIVTGQPGIGANSLLFTITSLTSTLNSTKANPAFFFIFSSAIYVNASLLL